MYVCMYMGVGVEEKEKKVTATDARVLSKTSYVPQFSSSSALPKKKAVQTNYSFLCAAQPISILFDCIISSLTIVQHGVDHCTTSSHRHTQVTQFVEEARHLGSQACRKMDQLPFVVFLDTAVSNANNALCLIYP